MHVHNKRLSDENLWIILVEIGISISLLALLAIVVKVVGYFI